MPSLGVVGSVTQWQHRKVQAATYRIGAQGQGQPVMVTENVTFWKLNPVLNTSPKGFGIYCWYNIS